MCNLSEFSVPEAALVLGTICPEGRLGSPAHPSLRNCWRKIPIALIIGSMSAI